MVTCTIANAQQTLMCVLDPMNYYAKGQDFKIKKQEIRNTYFFHIILFSTRSNKSKATKVKHSSSYSETM